MPPNQPATPNRTMRISDELWDEMKRVAADEGETVTSITIRLWARYIREHPAHAD